MDENLRADSVADVDALPRDAEAVFVTELTDAIAAALARLPRLRRLLHAGTSRLTDEGVRALVAIKSLQELDLEWSGAVTDAGLDMLAELPSLRWLDIGFCFSLSGEAIERLRRKLPALTVETSGETLVGGKSGRVGGPCLCIG